MFEIGKAASLAQAGVKGALAVMDAWEAGMSVGGPWAPLVAAAYAAAAGANALNLMNNIRSQQFGGGAGAGGVPNAPTQGASGVSPNGAGGGDAGRSGQTTIIQFHGGTTNERDMVKRLVDVINENSVNGGRVIVDER